MAERLKNILSIVNLAPGASVALPHDLQTAKPRPLAPDIIFIPTLELAVTNSDTTNVTVKNNSGVPISGEILVEAWHTVERAFNDINDEDLPVKPYIVVSDSALDENTCCDVVFRPGDPAGSRNNIFVTWAEAYAATRVISGHGPIDLILDDTYVPNALVVPAGQWAMDNIRLTSVEHAHEATYELADGCRFVMANPDLGLRIKGFGMNILSNRKGPVAPFSGLRVICEGMLLRFFNTDAQALPMFEAGPGGFGLLLFSGQNMLSGVGNPDVQSACPAPVIDAQGGVFVIEGGTGKILNNALRDTGGGGFVFFSVISDSFIGDSLNEFSFPIFVADGGVFHVDLSTNHVRHLVDPQSTGTPVVTSPYNASYNELVLVDTANSGGSVTVNMPTANPAKGERVTVKDIGGNTDANPITIAPTGTDTIDDGSFANTHISGNFGSKTYASDGKGHWWLVAVVGS